MWLITQVIAPTFDGVRDVFAYVTTHPVLPVAAVAVAALFATARRIPHGHR